MIVYTDRSRIATDENCARRRYYEYEYGGTGVTLDGDNTAGRDIGSCVHEGIAAILRYRLPLPLALDAAHVAPEFARLTEPTDRDMVDALLRTWFAVVYPQLVQGWVAEDCEREETVDFAADDATVRFMSRLDLLATATESATLNGAPVAPGRWIWDWKCVKRAGDRWRAEQRFEMQWLTSLLGPEARLGERLEGVIVCALVKEAHPLVSCWRNRETGETSNRFRYTCAEPHPFRYAKGGMCMGGVQHTLSKKDWEEVLVRDLPGGQAAHFDRLMATEPGLLAEWVDYAGPMIRVSDYEIERWKRQHLRREVEIAQARSAEPLLDEVLDRWFPQRMSACLKFARFEGAQPVGACPALGICHGGDSPENYLARENFNHPAEKESFLAVGASDIL